MGVSLGVGFYLPSPTADGVYPYLIPVEGGGPPLQTLNLIGRTGTGNWGPLNTPVFYNNLSQAIYLWGADATLLNAAPTGAPNNSSLVGATQYAAPEATSFCDVRVAHSDAAFATGSILDGSAAAIANLSAFYTGTDGNNITVTVALANGTNYVAGPCQVQVTVQMLNRATWVSPIFSAGASGYVKPTFLANLQAAILGATGSVPCPYITYVSAGSSAIHPAATANTFSGGNSGIDVTEADLIGSPLTGDNTGIYALQGTGINLLHVVGLTTMSYASVLAAFAQANTCFAFISLPSGTSTATGITSKNANNASSPWLSVTNDFTLATDVVDATGSQYEDPSVKIAGIVSQLSPYQDPSNKPYIGCQNLIGTIRTGTPYSQAELGLLQAAGILIINRPMNRGNFFGLPHGMTSDGITPIADTRMLNFIANAVTAILGQFVGESQSPPPAVGQPDNDVTRNNARNAVAAFLEGLANFNAPQIATWEQIMDGTNNTQSSVSQGYLYDRIEVTTLAGIKFILVGLQIGQTVQITTPGNT